MESYEQVFEALQEGKIDAGITNKDFGNLHESNYAIERTPIIFQPARMQFAFTKNADVTPSLIEKIDAHIKRLKGDKNSIYYQALDQYIGGKPVETFIEIIPEWIKITLAVGCGVILFLFAVGITSRIQVRRRTFELQKSEKKYRELADSLPQCVFEMDITGKAIYANQNAFDLFMYTKDEFDKGINLALLIVPEDHARAFENIQRILDGSELGGIEYMMIRHDGTTFPAMTHTNLVIQDGQPVGLRGLLIDISEQKKLEAQLQQAQKMEAIGTLAGGIAHDFNNILSPILGYADLLLMNFPEDSPLRDSLNNINTSALRAKHLVKQILSFARQEPNEPILMKLPPIVKEALKLIRSTIPTTIDIIQDINPDCGVIKADPTQIHQIVMNLTTNAYHAMEETGGELRVSLKEIQLGKQDVLSPDLEPGDYACLTVSDTGTGMDKTIIEKIFDPFFTTKEIGKGTGMGLSVVHGIVNSMKGSIHVYSEPGKGTEFKTYFPIEKSDFEKQSTRPEEPIRTGTERILLVDDEAAIIAMEKQVLEHLGYQVTSRTSSLEALEAFRANPNTFDLVITDMAMPNMPGDKLAVELTKIRPDIPILFCTGFSETMSKEKAASLGIKGFLLKPIVTKDLAQKIREVLDGNIEEPK
jgi:PAS domain S-box-containing protein